MRSHSYIFAGIIILLVCGAIGSFLLGTKDTTVSPTPPPQTPPPPPVTEVTPPPPTETTPDNSDKITVSAPLPNTKVTSPLTITGSARGTWYFEASFPVRLVDTNGNVIAQTPAQAQGEWMTENFVPFSATLTWATSTTAAGTLILMRDNPSGLPENDAEIRVPVTL